MCDVSQKQIHIKIASIEGHTDRYLAPAAAVEELRRLGHNSQRWIYVDGMFIGDLEAINEDMLIMAEDIMLTNPLAGG